MGEFNLFGSKIYSFDDIWLAEAVDSIGFTLCDVEKTEKGQQEPQVFVNGDVTTLKINGRVYHSKPEKGEKFDLEKGILVCIAKASGYSTSDVLKLRENAKVSRMVETKNTKNKKK